MNDSIITREFNYVAVLVTIIGVIVFLCGFSIAFALGFFNVTIEAIESSKLPLQGPGNQIESETGTEQENDDNWIQINHDLYGTRSSNQTTITKDNVSKLRVKWVLYNTI